MSARTRLVSSVSYTHYTRSYRSRCDRGQFFPYLTQPLKPRLCLLARPKRSYKGGRKTAPGGVHKISGNILKCAERTSPERFDRVAYWLGTKQTSVRPSRTKRLCSDCSEPRPHGIRSFRSLLLSGLQMSGRRRSGDYFKQFLIFKSPPGRRSVQDETELIEKYRTRPFRSGPVSFRFLPVRSVSRPDSERKVGRVSGTALLRDTRSW